MRHFLSVVLLLSVVAESAVAEWRSTDGSRFTFETTFEGEELPGEFQSFDVVLQLDKAALVAATLVVTVDLAGADMGDPDMNDVLSDAAWFDVDTVGAAVFSSDAIHEVSPDAYVATGTLDLKGIQRTVEVPFEFHNGDATRAIMRGRFSLRRTDFNVGTGEWSTDDTIGVDVSLSFDVKLVWCNE